MFFHTQNLKKIGGKFHFRGNFFFAHVSDKNETFVFKKSGQSLSRATKSHQKSQDNDILSLGLILAHLKHDEARFLKF